MGLPALSQVVGEYVLQAGTWDGRTPNGWTPPAGYLLGRGPLQFLGWWDTRPEFAPGPGADRLSAKSAPGGLTLRWATPAWNDLRAAINRRYASPAWGDGPGSLVLYVAGTDGLPATSEWGDARYPGVPPWSDGWAAAVASGSMQYATPSGVEGVGTAARPTLLSEVATRAHTRPMLDLLAYAGTPWSEADLVELAGGTRYVGVWLRAWWSRYQGSDPWSAISTRVPWVLQAGRPRGEALHRRAWHTAFPVRGGLAGAAAVALESGVHYGVGSPIAGSWRIACSNNGEVGGPDLWLGYELRSGQGLVRGVKTTAVANTSASWVSTPAGSHGGHAILGIAYADTTPPPGVVEGLCSVSVVAT